jgi:hypothetical protein
MKKKTEEESSRPRRNKFTHTHTQHPSIRTSKRFFLYDHTKIHFSKKKCTHTRRI